METHAVAVLQKTCQDLLTAPLSVAGQDLIDFLEEGLGYEYCALLVPGLRGNLLPVALSRQGQDEEFLLADKRFVARKCAKDGKGITGWVTEHGESLRLGDVRDDSRYLRMRDDIRSELCVPVLVNGTVFAVLNTETSRADAYRTQDQAILEIVADQIGLSVRKQHRLAASQSRPKQNVLKKCMYCGSLLDAASGEWQTPDHYLHSDHRLQLSHGVCPACGPQLESDLGFERS